MIAGFIGCTCDGRTTTLGRNGSVLTAAVVGAALKAEVVVVHADVPGVMTADPAVEPAAYPVSHLSYDEAVELSVLVM